MTRSIACTFLFLLSLAGLVRPAFAQHAAEESDSPIVVTGKLPLSKEQTLEVVRRASRSVDGQLARFKEPVCPRVTGFDTPYEAIVAARIREVAEAVGARVGGEGCVTNLYVVIVDDGREFVEELRRRHPEALAGLTKRELAALTGDPSAARSWSATALTNSAGAIAGRPSPSAGGGSVKSGFAGSSVGFGDVDVMRTYESSNINPSVQQAIVSAWVVIETRETFGKTLTQIADYAAMRGLAMVRPAELAASADTILALFEPNGDASMPELTGFDMAYLKGLYSTQGRRWARQQVRQLAEAIAQENERANP